MYKINYFKYFRLPLGIIVVSLYTNVCLYRNSTSSIFHDRSFFFKKVCLIYQFLQLQVGQLDYNYLRLTLSDDDDYDDGNDKVDDYGTRVYGLTRTWRLFIILIVVTNGVSAQATGKH